MRKQLLNFSFFAVCMAFSVSVNAQVSYDADTHVITFPGGSYEFVSVKGGSMKIGVTPEMEFEEGGDTLVVDVNMSDYYIGKLEVSQEFWTAVMGENVRFQGNYMNSRPDFPNLPAHSISWNEAVAFTQKLSQITGANISLPSEAQWEYAARGGQNSKGYKYSGSDDIDEVAWYINNTASGLLKGTSIPSRKNPLIREGGKKKANELGLYDMSGNLQEWCLDAHGPLMPTANTDYEKYKGRIIRGGSIAIHTQRCNVCKRAYVDNLDGRFFDLGIRLVINP